MLPSLLKQADVEFKYQDGPNDNRPSDRNRTLNTNSIALLNQVDSYLSKEKKSLGKIKIRMVIYNAIMTILIGVISVFDYKKDDWIHDGENA